MSPPPEPLPHPWPPQALSTVVVPARDAICSMYAMTKVSAPASLVFSTLLDTSTYPKWNTWCPRVTVRSQPDDVPSSTSSSLVSPVLQRDTRFIFHVVMDATKPEKFTDTSLRVTDMSTPEKWSDYVPTALLEDSSFMADLSRVYRVAWTTEGVFMARVMKGERFHEIIVLGEGECEVRTWECLGGVLARLVKWTYGETFFREKFRNWVRELKEECERRYERWSEMEERGKGGQ